MINPNLIPSKAERQLQVKPGLSFSISTVVSASKENSFTRMLYYKHTDGPMVELQFDFAGLDCEAPAEQQNVKSKISFGFSEEYLKAFSLDDRLGMRVFATEEQVPMCCNTQMLLHEIVNSNHKGAMEKMFLESKALALLLCTHHCYAQAEMTDCSSCKFLTKPYEKEKIMQARELLMANLDKGITIPQLSREVGINQCYLKKGFKELFNTTIFDFVQEQRMMKAKLMLSAGDASVTEIAFAVGYSNTSNFSNAFKKQTGILPSEFQRN